MLTTFALLASLSLPVAPLPTPDTLTAAERLRPSVAGMALTVPVHAPARLQPLERLERGQDGTEGDSPAEEAQLVEYSDGYFTRLTIHKWASYLTLPLFVGQYIVGQKLIDGEGSSGLRSAHGALAGGTAALFTVNTVTGVWNLFEARKDPEGKNRRTIHSVLMLLADAGFLATAALANENEHGEGGGSDNNAHRNMAIASMGTTLLSYAIMIPPLRRD